MPRTIGLRKLSSLLIFTIFIFKTLKQNYISAKIESLKQLLDVWAKNGKASILSATIFTSPVYMPRGI